MEHNQKYKGKKQKGTKGSKARHVLDDHAQFRKKFRPPLLDYMLTAGHGPPDLEWVRWALPEVLWIKLLISEHGLRKAGELAHSAVMAGRAVAGAAMRSYCLASDYVFTEEERAKFVDALGDSPANELSRAFAVFVKLYSEFPMAWLVRKTDLEGIAGGADELEEIKRLLHDVRSRRDRPAMEIQVCAMFSIEATGSLIMHDMPDLNLISDYPETDPSRLMGARVRAALNVFLGRATGSGWAKAFWERGRRISPCQDLRWEVPMPNPTALMEANQAGTRFARAAARLSGGEPACRQIRAGCAKPAARRSPARAAPAARPDRRRHGSDASTHNVAVGRDGPAGDGRDAHPAEVAGGSGRRGELRVVRRATTALARRSSTSSTSRLCSTTGSSEPTTMRSRLRSKPGSPGSTANGSLGCRRSMLAAARTTRISAN